MSVIESFVPVYHGSGFECSIAEPVDSNSFFLLSLKRTEVYPDRPNIVFLHGWFGSSEDFNFALQKYQDRYNLFAFDLRGHGDSDSPLDRSWSIHELAADIHCVLSQFLGKNYRASFIASSLSAAVALTYAQKYPQFVEKMVLISPTTKFSIPLWLKSLARVSPKKLIKLTAKVFEQSIKFFASEKEMNDYRKFFDRLINAPLEIQKKIVEETLASYSVDVEKLQQIHSPILILAGQDDKVIPYDDTAKLHSYLPNSVLITFEEMKHRLLSQMPELILTLSMLFMEDTSLFQRKNIVN